jgi:hypothetical protein
MQVERVCRIRHLSVLGIAFISVPNNLTKALSTTAIPGAFNGQETKVLPQTRPADSRNNSRELSYCSWILLLSTFSVRESDVLLVLEVYVIQTLTIEIRWPWCIEEKRNAAMQDCWIVHRPVMDFIFGMTALIRTRAATRVGT